MNLGIDGKLALVVGATGDTGRAVALSLAAEGCRLVAVARGAERLYEVGQASPADCHCFPADLMAEDQPQALVDAVLKVGSPDIVVHVMGGSMGLKDAMLPASDWAKVWRLNVGVAHDINRAFLPKMLERKWGRIVHFSSNGVKLAIGNPPYSAAKAAVEGYVRTVGRQVAAGGVVITAVAPGPIYTEGRGLYTMDEEKTKAFIDSYVPMKRWGRGDELAKTVAFLCSEGASYMAGAVVEVDGGMR